MQKERQLLNKQIVCFSTHYWDDAWFRKQHFMSRFVKKGFRVAYIEPSFSMVKKPDADKANFQTNRLFGVTVVRKSENLVLIKPPQGIPFWSRPLVSQINYRYFAYVISRALREIGFKDYILWNYRPEYAFALRAFDYRNMVFDLTDDLAAYRGKHKEKFEYVKKCTDYLVDNADLLIVTASTLQDMYRDRARRISLVPNGYDMALFSTPEGPAPDDIRDVPTPIVGFVGTLFSFLDYDLIRFIVEKNTEKSFVFIGNCEGNSVNQWEKITKFKNVYWLGRKKKEEIPLYLNMFDVCINPFRVDDVSKSISPLKVFEYLAMKKPVVSVRMESLEREVVAPFIRFATSYEDFHKQIESALKDRAEFRKRLDMEKVGAYSWDRLFERVYQLVAGL